MPAPAGTRLTEPELDHVLDRVVVAPEARGHPDLAELLGRARSLGLPIRRDRPDPRDGSVNRRYRRLKRTLYVRRNRGSFIKPWGSPSSIVGRDEWCLTPVEGCPMDCSYCYLQGYLDSPLVQTFVNRRRMADHVREFAEDPPEPPPHFFSLGELSDGLLLEPLTRSLSVVWDVFRDVPAKLEVRTKSDHVLGLPDRLEPHSSGVFSWSLSPEGTARREEMLTAPLDRRLAAMRYMLDAGFRVAARLDPVLLVDGWFDRYRDLVARMDDFLDPEDLLFVLVGVFRFPRGFDRTIEERFSHRRFLRDEFVEGPDGKLRYPRGRRADAYRRLVELLRGYGADPSLCMEPSYVWEDAGMTPPT